MEVDGLTLSLTYQSSTLFLKAVPQTLKSNRLEMVHNKFLTLFYACDKPLVLLIV